MRYVEMALRFIIIRCLIVGLLDGQWAASQPAELSGHRRGGVGGGDEMMMIVT